MFVDPPEWHLDKHNLYFICRQCIKPEAISSSENLKLQKMSSALLRALQKSFIFNYYNNKIQHDNSIFSLTLKGWLYPQGNTLFSTPVSVWTWTKPYQRKVFHWGKFAVWAATSSEGKKERKREIKDATLSRGFSVSLSTILSNTSLIVPHLLKSNFRQVT